MGDQNNAQQPQVGGAVFNIPGIPTVLPAEAEKFAQVWRYNGVAVMLDKTHCQFATDFANTVLRSFMQMMQAQAIAALKAAQAQKPIVTGE